VSILAENKKAYYDYQILETFEAGIELLGQEAKSIRRGRCDLAGSYVILRNGEAWLVGAKIHPFQPKNVSPNYDPQRTRKLLLKKKELRYLLGKVGEKRLTLIPLKVYNRGRYLKVEFALAKGKKAYEKRERIKKRETQKAIERTLKQY